MGRERLDYRPHQHGFSLMEVLIALVVVTFALYGVLDLIASNQRISLRTQRRAAAIGLGRAKMAEIQTAGFDAVASLLDKGPGGPSQSLVYPSESSEFKAPYAAKAFRWQARFDRNSQQPEVIAVEVRVLWYQPTTGAAEEALSNSVSVGGLLVGR